MLGKIHSTILNLDTLENKLAAKLKSKAHLYDVCRNGCMLFEKTDDLITSCKHCQSPRYINEVTKRSFKQMKMLSIGDQVAKLLASEVIRSLMKYRHNYQHEDGVYRDCFDGEEYQSLLRNTDLFSGEDDVAMALFVDGFTPGKANSGAKLTIVHLINLNIPPQFR